MLRHLAHQVRAMRSVNIIVAKPNRPAVENATVEDESFENFYELHSQRVFESAMNPLSTDFCRVHRKPIFGAPPHTDSRMVAPPRTGVTAMLPNIDAEREKNLLRLDALLAKPAVVEAPGRIHERVVGKKSLHCVLCNVGKWSSVATAAILCNREIGGASPL